VVFVRRGLRISYVLIRAWYGSYHEINAVDTSRLARSAPGAQWVASTASLQLERVYPICVPFTPISFTQSTTTGQPRNHRRRAQHAAAEIGEEQEEQEQEQEAEEVEDEDEEE
jgi:hypothetical protein